MSAWIDELNASQQEAVRAGDGPLLIVAGAGTGKTRTLACRVAYLIEQGVAAERILLLTFTRRAAQEMLRRASQVLHSARAGATNKVWGGTFHAVANRLLRMYGTAVSLPPEFTVLDQSDAADLMNLIRNEQGLGKGDRRFPRKQTLLSIYSRMVNAQESLSETLELHFPWCETHKDSIASLFNGYATRKKEQFLLDYDDLLLFWSALCTTPTAGESISRRFEHILVDEYQDTNPVQAEILRGMRRTCGNICVVGDDAQSIYSFRAATVRNILDFPKHFPGTRIVTLEQNYRSTLTILAASNSVMEQARERFTKNLWSDRQASQKPVINTCLDEPEQSNAVCANILEHLERGVALMQQAVLFRASHHSAHLEIELARRNIPFRKYGGLKFVEAAHIKDLLALLRVLENPYDEIGWFRVLQLLEGIGPRTARKIMDQLGVRRQGNPPTPKRAASQTVVSPLVRLIFDPPTVPPAAQSHFEQFRAVLAQCSGLARLHPTAPADPTGSEPLPLAPDAGERPTALSIAEPEDDWEESNADETVQRPRSQALPLAAQIERIRQFYEPVLERVYENTPPRLRDLEQLSQIAAGYRSRSRFLSDLTLDPPSGASDYAGAPFLEEDYLILSTIHSAKGCEWTVVHIIHASDGFIPLDMSLGEPGGEEEERRLLYVAMTRAKDMLYVYFPLRYYHRRSSSRDAHHLAQLSRYLYACNRTLFERRTAVPSELLQGPEPPAYGLDPYRRVVQLWET